VVFVDGATVESPGLIKALPSVTVVAYASGLSREDADLSIVLTETDKACVLPDGDPFRAQLLIQPARRALADMVDSLTCAEYSAAPWWSADDDAQPDPQDDQPVVDEPVVLDELDAAPLDDGDGHPRLLVLGPMRLVGARGMTPTRALRSCEEYCGWLLRNPGQTTATMVRSLLVAEGTRRSNVSRLRLWLGCDTEGQPYLPDGHSGLLRLHPGVTSDWDIMQGLVAGGVNRASTRALAEALRLVRGAPLAGAAPGQWHWAETWRVEMMSMIRDIGVVLCQRAIDRQDVGLARWAAERALLAAPEDELLLMARIRTEHLAGNRGEVERLAFHVTRSSKTLGFDLSDDMVALLQEVIEGTPRLRLAS